VDLLIGISEPTEGTIEIFGNSPYEYVRRHPGDIAYVPQDVVICTGTFRSNIELGFPSGTFKDEEIWLALEKTELSGFVSSHPEKLDSKVGENGGRLSGGQKQRLGFARALVGNPKILILDEATSSLDMETEETLSKFINSLKGDVTVISIAHRLRTILNASKIVYLENGFVVAEGNFEEVKTKVPNFEKQLKLIGLDR
jgi:ATP-binding cassette subfamily C protein